MSDFKATNEKILDGITAGYEKIEEGVVSGYKKVENTVVGGFNKITDQFVGKFLIKDGEKLSDAKARLIEEQKAREAAQKERVEASIAASRNAGKRYERKYIRRMEI